MKLAEHIFVTGHSGSGKTTLAKQLSESKNMPMVSLDDVMDKLVEQDPDKYGKFYNFPDSLRRDAINYALNTSDPTIFEGTQVLVDPELTKNHSRILIDIPESRIIEQRVARQMLKKKYDGVPRDFHVAQAKDLINLYSDELNKFKAQDGVRLVKPKYEKQSEYRDRATLILHDGKGNVFAAPELDDPLKMPYHFPGGGIYDVEDINNPLPSNELVEAGLRREALEELGYKLKNIQDFGYGPKNIDMGHAWRARAMAKRGQPFKGIREHLRAAEIEAEDNSLLNSEGDSFHNYYPEYVEANLLAKQIEDHALANKHRISSSELANRAGISKFIRNLAKEKTAEEKRYRPKVQGLLYTPDLRVLAAKSQGAGSGLRQFNNYKFPGGGIEPGESLVDAAKKELLEETGYSTSSDPFEFGMPAITVDWDDAFRQQALKKGRDFHGEISHFLAAPVGAKDMSLHGKEGDQLLDADFVPIDSLIADLEHTSSLPDNEYAMFDKNKLEAARKFKEHMRTKKAYYVGRRLAIMSHS